VTGPAEVHRLEEVVKYVDLSPFRARFAGGDHDVSAAFDTMAAELVRLVFNEAALR
jgi:hypothetical protein